MLILPGFSSEYVAAFLFLLKIHKTIYCCEKQQTKKKQQSFNCTTLRSTLLYVPFSLCITFSIYFCLLISLPSVSYLCPKVMCLQMWANHKSLHKPFTRLQGEKKQKLEQLLYWFSDCTPYWQTVPPRSSAPHPNPNISLSTAPRTLNPPYRMFSSKFLGGGNPLSAMSTAVNKFSLFGDETEDGKEKQPQGPLKQKTPEQHGNGQPASQGSKIHSTEKPPEGRMDDAQKQGMGKGLPQHPAPGRGSPQQQRAGRGGPHHQGLGRGKSPQCETGGGGPLHRDPTGPETHRAETAAASASGPMSLCPICKNTKLNLQSKEPPNYNTCTQCKSVVCSMCGFSPPDAAVSNLYHLYFISFIYSVKFHTSPLALMHTFIHSKHKSKVWLNIVSVSCPLFLACVVQD